MSLNCFCEWSDDDTFDITNNCPPVAPLTNVEVDEPLWKASSFR